LGALKTHPTILHERFAGSLVENVAMPNYLRVLQPGGTYFFTVNLLERNGNDLLIRHIDALREAVRETRKQRPFEIVAWVVLPDHMHAIWTLPENDCDYATRWKSIKTRFGRAIPNAAFTRPDSLRNGERGIWQRRFWEHTIRDDRDLSNHIDYVHFNPVKHGYVKNVTDWPHSSVHRFI
jgi:putative transposase